MNLTSVLATASALSLLIASGALGNDNFSNVLQHGNNNSGSVTQGLGDGNDVGLEALAARQTGNQNLLTFLQSGANNGIGTDGTGFHQNSNRSTATITQSSDNNVLRQVTQTGIASGTGGVTLRRNKLTIEQGASGSGGNIVGRVSQTRADGFLGAPSQAGNTASIVQAGAGGNIVGSPDGVADGLTQSGRSHLANVTQTGGGNLLVNLVQASIGQTAAVNQTGTGNVVQRVDQQGLSHQATITQNGADNGTAEFDTGTRSGGWAFLAQGRAYQSGGLLGGNRLDYRSDGANNSYGFNQNGSNNDTLGTVTQNDNQSGVIQDGQSNLARFTVDGMANHVFIHQGLAFINIGNDADILITGDSNHVGVIQNGTNNDAGVAIANGNGNTVNIDQESVLRGNTTAVTITNGNSNNVGLTQSGSNVANVAITGSFNLLDSSQIGIGNTLLISLNGDSNNVGAFTQGKPAHTTARLLTPALVPGQIIQNGLGNSIEYSVGNLNSSNDNKFAFYQNGNGNFIEGSTNGNGNEVAIVQQGNLNHAWFRQNGVGNIIGVSQ